MVRLLDSWDGRYDFLGADGEVFYLLTTQSAPLGRIIAVSPECTGACGNWREVVPEASVAIASAALIGGRLVVEYVQDAHAELRLYKLDGEPAADVQLPGQGSVAGFPGTPDDPETFLVLHGLHDTPRTIWRLDTATGEAQSSCVPAGRMSMPDRFVTRQVFYTSRDGTRVPMYIVHRKDLVLGRAAADGALWLRWLQRVADAGLFGGTHGLDRSRWRLRTGQSARWRRVRRGLASGRHKAQQAERLR